MKWAPDEDAMLKDMAPRHSNAELARLMGRSESSVIARLNILGITRPKRDGGSIGTSIALSATMKAKLQADADKRNITIGSIVREIIATHYGLDEPTLALTGGARAGSGRRPRAKIVSNQYVPTKIGKPSMPAIPARST